MIVYPWSVDFTTLTSLTYETYTSKIKYIIVGVIIIIITNNSTIIFIYLFVTCIETLLFFFFSNEIIHIYLILCLFI